jgi:TolB protein
LIDVVTGEERYLVPGRMEGNIDPAWSPDGSMIVFASNRSGSEEIWVINANGTGLHQLTSDGKLHRFPVWGSQ